MYVGGLKWTSPPRPRPKVVFLLSTIYILVVLAIPFPLSSFLASDSLPLLSCSPYTVASLDLLINIPFFFYQPKLLTYTFVSTQALVLVLRTLSLSFAPSCLFFNICYKHIPQPCHTGALNSHHFLPPLTVSPLESETTRRHPTFPSAPSASVRQSVQLPEQQR